jgi:hypothetical protein
MRIQQSIRKRNKLNFSSEVKIIPQCEMMDFPQVCIGSIEIVNKKNSNPETYMALLSDILSIDYLSVDTVKEDIVVKPYCKTTSTIPGDGAPTVICLMNDADQCHQVVDVLQMYEKAQKHDSYIETGIFCLVIFSTRDVPMAYFFQTSYLLLLITEREKKKAEAMQSNFYSQLKKKQRRKDKLKSQKLMRDVFFLYSYNGSYYFKEQSMGKEDKAFYPVSQLERSYSCSVLEYKGSFYDFQWEIFKLSLFVPKSRDPEIFISAFLGMFIHTNFTIAVIDDQSAESTILPHAIDTCHTSYQNVGCDKEAQFRKFKDIASVATDLLPELMTDVQQYTNSFTYPQYVKNYRKNFNHQVYKCSSCNQHKQKYLSIDDQEYRDQRDGFLKRVSGFTYGSYNNIGYIPQITQSSYGLKFCKFVSVSNFEDALYSGALLHGCSCTLFSHACNGVGCTSILIASERQAISQIGCEQRGGAYIYTYRYQGLKYSLLRRSAVQLHSIFSAFFFGRPFESIGTPCYYVDVPSFVTSILDYFSGLNLNSQILSMDELLEHLIIRASGGVAPRPVTYAFTALSKVRRVSTSRPEGLYERDKERKRKREVQSNKGGMQEDLYEKLVLEDFPSFEDLMTSSFEGCNRFAMTSELMHAYIIDWFETCIDIYSDEVYLQGSYWPIVVELSQQKQDNFCILVKMAMYNEHYLVPFNRDDTVADVISALYTVYNFVEDCSVMNYYVYHLDSLMRLTVSTQVYPFRGSWLEFTIPSGKDPGGC